MLRSLWWSSTAGSGDLWLGRCADWPINRRHPAQNFRDQHHSGFSRFKLTETSKLISHPLELATICSDGTSVRSEHYIVAEKSEASSWSFAATLRPLGRGP